jgi:hypothetical protein
LEYLEVCFFEKEKEPFILPDLTDDDSKHWTTSNLREIRITLLPEIFPFTHMLIRHALDSITRPFYVQLNASLCRDDALTDAIDFFQDRYNDARDDIYLDFGYIPHDCSIYARLYKMFKANRGITWYSTYGGWHERPPNKRLFMHRPVRCPPGSPEGDCIHALSIGDNNDGGIDETTTCSYPPCEIDE